MKTSIINTVFILCIFSFSCQHRDSHHLNNEAIEINLDVSERTNEVHLSQFLSNTEYIPLETNSSCLIGSIKKIEIFDGRIFILDPYMAQKLLVFDKTGKFLYQIAKRGKGPGEYTHIFDFVIKDRNLYLLDSRKSVIEYTLDGKYINTYSLPIWADKLFSINNNYWGLLTNADKIKDNDYSFYVTSLDFKKEKGFLHNKFGNFPIEPITQVSLLNDTSYFFMSSDNIIYQTTTNDATEKYVLLYPKDCILDESELSSYSNMSIQERTMDFLDNSISLSSIIFTNELKMILYDKKSEPYICFINNEKEYFSIPEKKIINNIDSVPFLPIFYSTMNPNNIIASFDTYKIVDALNSDFEIGSRIKKTISENTGESNPIIVIYSSDKSK